MDNTSMDIMITLFCWASYAHIIWKTMKINVHFRPVTENRHISNLYIDDTVVNKPFKHAVKLGYKNHLDGNNAALWQPKLTVGALKPFITAWVALGIQALKTPEMKVTIRNAFTNDGLFTAIRDPIKLLKMQVESE